MHLIVWKLFTVFQRIPLEYVDGVQLLSALSQCSFQGSGESLFHQDYKLQKVSKCSCDATVTVTYTHGVKSEAFAFELYLPTPPSAGRASLHCRIHVTSFPGFCGRSGIINISLYSTDPGSQVANVDVKQYNSESLCNTLPLTSAGSSAYYLP
ncbi:hypothetical protein NE237_013123 [Protea cynaroides]|uniref:Uncharacterized protein n=1 Tax=Protea cynaroides TaxID=273540 RepID=A0A9Q0GZB9_9MAGN|nr:hypothetical protein NE237_013123 [Protea cynaroides]